MENTHIDHTLSNCNCSNRPCRYPAEDDHAEDDHAKGYTDCFQCHANANRQYARHTSTF